MHYRKTAIIVGLFFMFGYDTFSSLVSTFAVDTICVDLRESTVVSKF